MRVKELNYSTVHTPVEHDASYEDKKAYMDCAKENNILIESGSMEKSYIS